MRPAELDHGPGEAQVADEHGIQADDELIMHLEPDQFVAATAEPVPRAPLGPRAKAVLWSLRIFVVLVSVMVVYTFVDRLH
ncbi:MAG: hypothetical protein E6G62_04440 [Actinobacteria bacterium]|nr:MAG: hypothetical protein E6G62_04440 [Actinomycetota bacterium]